MVLKTYSLHLATEHCNVQLWPWWLRALLGSYMYVYPQSYALFTLDICFCINITVKLTLTQRKGSDPFCAFMFASPLMFSVVTLTVTVTQTQMSGMNTPLEQSRLTTKMAIQALIDSGIRLLTRHIEILEKGYVAYGKYIDAKITRLWLTGYSCRGWKECNMTLNWHTKHNFHRSFQINIYSETWNFLEHLIVMDTVLYNLVIIFWFNWKWI